MATKAMNTQSEGLFFEPAAFGALEFMAYYVQRELNGYYWLRLVAG